MTQAKQTDNPPSATSEMIGGLSRIGRRIGHIEEIGVIAALLVMALALSLTTTSFLSSTNLLQVARQASYYGIMAIGMVFVMSMADIDLSVGSVLMLTNIVSAIALRDGYPLLVAMLIGLLTGALCGFVNGVLSVILRIPTIIVTLGTMSIYRGLGLVISNAAPISKFPKDNWFFTVGGGDILGIPTSVVLMLAVGVFGYILFNQSAFGRRVQAIGSNLQAARFSGIRIARHRIMAMTLMGMISALAGLAALAFLQSADPTTGQGFELLVIASTIIGGTALSGGSGSILGAILGALIIAVIRNGLVLLGLSAYWGLAATGAVIIAAVALDYFIKRR
jgi:ribose transport system permease protein